jgi:uncharacterized lipoprotein NlpE involved in copper resistance
MKDVFLACCVAMVFAAIGCEGGPPSDVSGTDITPTGVVERHEAPDESVMRGRFTFMADAAVFEACSTGRVYPVAMEADYITAERAYLAARSAPGEPLLVVFEGRIEPRPPMDGNGMVEMIVIDRFDAAFPGEGCDLN